MPEYAHGELKFKILECLKDKPFTMDDLVDWLVTPGTGSKGGWDRSDRFEFNKRRWRRHLDEERKKAEQKVYSLLYRLEKSGLVEKQVKKDISFWKTTKEYLVKNSSKNIQKDLKQYQLKPSLHKVVIIFDMGKSLCI